MPVRAVFFDVGDTLVQHWKPHDEVRRLVRDALRRELGDRDWYDRFVESDIVPKRIDEEHRQETNRWYEQWFRNSQIGIDDIDIDRLRSVVTVPLDLVGSLVPGTREALAGAKDHGLTVGLNTNTLSRGDEEVRRDWERFGLADQIDVVASSHSVGWYKPHEEIFRRALRDAQVSAEDAVMVGDRLREDVWGAKRLGMRAVWRRPLGGPPQAEIDTRPDATIDDLTQLPPLVRHWLS